jgi:hypothetical protein
MTSHYEAVNRNNAHNASNHSSNSNNRNNNNSSTNSGSYYDSMSMSTSTSRANSEISAISASAARGQHHYSTSSLNRRHLLPLHARRCSSKTLNDSDGDEIDDVGDDECPTPSQDSDLTPSPSDSGVAELEAMIREKNSEISTLRQSMEEKDQVICKVVEEKEKTWERELRKIKGMYENRLKSAQQRALRIEQSLTTQNYQVSFRSILFRINPLGPFLIVPSGKSEIKYILLIFQNL